MIGERAHLSFQSIITPDSPTSCHCADYFDTLAFIFFFHLPLTETPFFFKQNEKGEKNTSDSPADYTHTYTQNTSASGCLLLPQRVSENSSLDQSSTYARQLNRHALPVVFSYSATWTRRCSARAMVVLCESSARRPAAARSTGAHVRRRRRRRWHLLGRVVCGSGRHSAGSGSGSGSGSSSKPVVRGQRRRHDCLARKIHGSILILAQAELGFVRVGVDGDGIGPARRRRRR